MSMLARAPLRTAALRQAAVRRAAAPARFLTPDQVRTLSSTKFMSRAAARSLLCPRANLSVKLTTPLPAL